MARPLSGQVIFYEHAQREDATYMARVTWRGRRLCFTLGRRSNGWNDHRARRAVDQIVADIRAGRWRPPQRKGVDEPVKLPKGDARAKTYSLVRKALQEADHAHRAAVDREQRAQISEAISALYMAEDALASARL